MYILVRMRFFLISQFLTITYLFLFVIQLVKLITNSNNSRFMTVDNNK